MVLDNRDIADEISAKDQPARPQETANHIAEEKIPVSHFPDTGKEGSKRPDIRDKPGDNDRRSAVLIVKVPGFIDPFSFDKRTEPAGYDLFPHVPPDPEIDCVAKNCGKCGHKDQYGERKCSCASERPGNKEERVPGKEGKDDKTGLAEDDEEQDNVDEYAKFCGHLGK